MPYIPSVERRAALSQSILTVDAQSKGELNYVLCEIVQNYLGDQDPKTLGYTTLSEAGDALIDAWVEYNRCVLAPYEERKRKENSDVWWINEVIQ